MRSRGWSGWTPAQITQADLVPYLLDVVAWSPRLEQFEWFETPPEHAGGAGRWGVLERLGGIEYGGEGVWRVTQEGEALRRLPIHPRLGAMVRQGARDGVGREAAMAAALLSEGDFVDDVGHDGHQRCDLWPRVEVLCSRRAESAARGRGWRVRGGADQGDRAGGGRRCGGCAGGSRGRGRAQKTGRRRLCGRWLRGIRTGCVLGEARRTSEIT